MIILKYKCVVFVFLCWQYYMGRILCSRFWILGASRRFSIDPPQDQCSTSDPTLAMITMMIIIIHSVYGDLVRDRGLGKKGPLWLK